MAGPAPDLQLSKGFYPWAQLARWSLKGNDPSQWKPVRFKFHSDGNPTEETARGPQQAFWLYVLQSTGPLGSKSPPSGATPKLWRVYTLQQGDSPGLFVWSADTDAVKSNPSVVTVFDQPHQTALAHALTFPDARTSTKEQYFYHFFVSRIPLETSDLITELESKIASFIPAVNLPDASARRSFKFLWATVQAALIPSFDAITIAEVLHERYVKACDDYIKFNAVADDMTAEEQEKTSYRMLKELLGRSIKHVIDNDADNDLKIDDRSGTLGRIKTFMDDVDKARAKLLKNRNDCADDLRKWVNGPAWQFARKSYVDPSIGQKHDRAWKDIIDDVVIDRASESDQGKVLLLDWITNKTEYIINEYYLRESDDLDEARSEIAKTTSEKSVKSIMEFIPEVIEHDRAHGAKTLIAGLNHMVRMEMFQALDAIEKPHLVLSYPKGTGIEPVEIYPTLVKMNPALAEDKISEWFDSNTALHNRMALLALFNFALSAQEAFKKLSDTDGATTEQVLSSLKAATGSVEAVAAIGKALGRDPKLMRVVGQTGAVMGIVSASSDAWAKFDAGDYDAAGGDLVISIGSALQLCVELELVAPVWGLVAAVIAITGAVLVAIFTDTDINSFIKNTVFGSNAKSLPDKKPKWSPTNMSEWKDDVEGIKAQIDAFLHVVSGFELSPGQMQSFRFRPCGFLASSQIQINDVKVTYQNSDVVLEGKGLLDVNSWILTPDPQNDAKCTMWSSTGLDGRGRYVDIFIDWKDHQFPLPPNQSAQAPKVATSTCSVRMDLYGDGTSMVPLGGNAQYTFYDSLSLHQLDPLLSKDCE